jgi:hypothetical protein
MKKNYFLIAAMSLLLTVSCTVQKNFVYDVVKEGVMKSPKVATVLVTGFENIRLNSFKNTYEKNFASDSLFIESYVEDFIIQSEEQNLYAAYQKDFGFRWKELNKGISADRDKLAQMFDESNVDYIITFTKFGISNRVETNYSPPIGMNGGMGTHNSVEFCVIDVNVIIYDTKKREKVMEFVTKGESSVFLFDFTKTFLKAKERSIEHMIKFLKKDS